MLSGRFHWNFSNPLTKLESQNPSIDMSGSRKFADIQRRNLAETSRHGKLPTCIFDGWKLADINFWGSEIGRNFF